MWNLPLAVKLGRYGNIDSASGFTTHSPYTPEERALSGISEGLVRLSVGLEHADDIIEDLKQLLDKIV